MKFLFALTAILALFFGCSSGTSESETKKVDRDFELVNYLSTQMLNPRIEIMRDATSELTQSIHGACMDNEPIMVEKLQALWVYSMDAFHYSEVFLYGPILIDDASKLDDDNEVKRILYSLHDPRIQSKEIERQIGVANKKQEKYKPRDNPLIMGFDALEYVLFGAMGASEKLQASSIECVYLMHTSRELNDRIKKVESDWTTRVILPLQTPQGKVLVNRYLDSFTKGLISFADKTLKDRKLAAPLNIDLHDKNSFPCELGIDCHLKYLEHSYSLRAYNAMDTHLRAISDAFDGEALNENGFGYIKYFETGNIAGGEVTKSLSKKGFSKQWKKLPQSSDYYLAFAEYDGDANSTNAAYSSYKNIKKLTDWLKTDFILNLNAELPGNVKGESD